MCLWSNNKEPKKAEEDIVAYKVLYRENGVFYAPFVEDMCSVKFIYKKGENIPAACSWFESEPVLIRGAYKIGNGWLHTYENEHEANYIKKILNSQWALQGKHFVVKMVIPKNCEYYISDNGEEYCSQCLIWDGEILID